MTNNYFHDFARGTAAVWFDTEEYGNVISGNTIIAAGGWPAIDIEATTCTEVTGNAVILPADGSATGIFVANSQNTIIHNNLVKAPAGGGNYVHHNALFLGGNTQMVGYFCLVVSPSDCASAMVSNRNLYDYNAYQLPDASGYDWFHYGSVLSWSQWQSAGQDLHGIK